MFALNIGVGALSDKGTVMLLNARDALVPRNAKVLDSAIDLLMSSSFNDNRNMSFL